MTHEELMELAPLYVVSQLEEGENAEFEEHLRGGCRQCTAEVAWFRETATMIALDAEPVSPSLAVRSRVLALAPPDPPPVPAGMIVVRGGEEGWRPTPFAGILMKKLFFDRERDQLTMLLRVSPGARYPAHRHGIPEHCLVLEGDMRIGSLVLNAGDYTVALGGSEHCELTSQNGCVCLLVCSPHDELLA